jgi:hypothetical protein
MNKRDDPTRRIDTLPTTRIHPMLLPMRGSNLRHSTCSYLEVHEREGGDSKSCVKRMVMEFSGDISLVVTPL